MTRWPVFIGNWSYESYLLNPSEADFASPVGSNAMARKWAKGEMEVNDNVGPDVSRRLIFGPGLELEVSLNFDSQDDDSSFLVKGVGVGSTGPLAGITYELRGWASAKEDELIERIEGSVRLRSAPTGKDIGGAPVGTVGTFILVPADR